jgi:formylmethanofuran dehydrogenase subunit E
MADTLGCKYTGIEKDYSIEDLAAFHGHLGPFIVLGYRMGKYAKQHFCRDPFQMNATVYCSGIPPESCLADGIQIGSGCTLGKRNIAIVACNEIKCEFMSNGKKLSLRSRPIKFPSEGDGPHGKLIEELAETMYNMPDFELFSISSD